MRSRAGNQGREGVQQRRFARARPTGEEHVLVRPDGVGEVSGNGRGQGPDLDEVVEAVAAGELPNRQDRSGRPRTGEHRRDARAVFEACVEQGLRLGNLIPAAPARCS